jgi:hypothetical protein
MRRKTMSTSIHSSRRFLAFVALLAMLTGSGGCEGWDFAHVFDGFVMGPGYQTEGRTLTWAGSQEVPEAIFGELDAIMEKEDYQVEEIQAVYRSYGASLQEPAPTISAHVEKYYERWEPEDYSSHDFVIQLEEPVFFEKLRENSKSTVVVSDSRGPGASEITFQISESSRAIGEDYCTYDEMDPMEWDYMCWDVREVTNYQVLLVLGYF